MSYCLDSRCHYYFSFLRFKNEEEEEEEEEEEVI